MVRLRVALLYWKTLKGLQNVAGTACGDIGSSLLGVEITQFRSNWTVYFLREQTQLTRLFGLAHQ